MASKTQAPLKASHRAHYFHEFIGSIRDRMVMRSDGAIWTNAGWIAYKDFEQLVTGCPAKFTESEAEHFCATYNGG